MFMILIGYRNVALITYIFTTLHNIEAYLNLFKSGTEIMNKYLPKYFA